MIKEEVDYIEETYHTYYVKDGVTISEIKTVRTPKIDILNKHIEEINSSEKYFCELCNKHVCNINACDMNCNYIYCNECVAKHKTK